MNDMIGRIRSLARQLEAEGPDEFPFGYYLHLATRRVVREGMHTVEQPWYFDGDSPKFEVDRSEWMTCEDKDCEFIGAFPVHEHPADLAHLRLPTEGVN